MQIIGIAGPIGHGKSTLASLLCTRVIKHQRIESSDIIADVANDFKRRFNPHISTSDIPSLNSWLSNLPDILAKHVNLHIDPSILELDEQKVNSAKQDYEKLFIYIDRLKDDPSLVLEKITPENKEKHRAILQWLGGYFVTNIDSGIWFREIVRRARKASELGTELFTVSGVRFPSDAEVLKSADAKIVKIIRPAHAKRDSNDSTEQQADDIAPDITLYNNGNLNELEDCVAKLMDDLSSGQQSSTYYARAH